MPDGSAKKPSRIQQRNRRAILDAALDVFSRHGYRGATLDVKILPLFEKERPWEELAQLPLFTPGGRQVPLSAVAMGLPLINGAMLLGCSALAWRITRSAVPVSPQIA